MADYRGLKSEDSFAPAGYQTMAAPSWCRCPCARRGRQQLWQLSAPWTDAGLSAVVETLRPSPARNRHVRDRQTGCGQVDADRRCAYRELGHGQHRSCAEAHALSLLVGAVVGPVVGA